MRGVDGTRWWLAVTAVLYAGCQGSPFSSKAPTAAQQQTVKLAQQNRQLQARLGEIDANNQQWMQMIAEGQKQSQLLASENQALREQLQGVTAQVARLRADGAANKKKFENLQASMRRQGGAMIRPNNSLQQDLPAIDIPGVEVRRDGDVVRVDIAAHRLFLGEDARLSGGGGKLLEAVADEVARRYPDQRISVEGHTDRDPVRPGRFVDNHQFTLLRARAVFDHLARHTRLTADQLIIAGYGGSRPFASNANAAGRQRNRRIELVIQPERVRN